MTEKIIGTDGHEEIFGTAEDDTIESLSGYDTLDGGEGSDTYIVNADDYLGRFIDLYNDCLLYTSPSPRDQRGSRMPSSA